MTDAILSINFNIEARNSCGSLQRNENVLMSLKCFGIWNMIWISDELFSFTSLFLRKWDETRRQMFMNIERLM